MAKHKVHSIGSSSAVSDVVVNGIDIAILAMLNKKQMQGRQLPSSFLFHPEQPPKVAPRSPTLSGLKEPPSTEVLSHLFHIVITMLLHTLHGKPTPSPNASEAAKICYDL